MKKGTDEFAWIDELTEGLFPGRFGIRYLEAGKERVRAELVVTRELCTPGGRMHGGAVMSFADTLGALGTVVNLPSGAHTTTIESKTNFIAAAPEGETVTADCQPLHRGGQTMVWQTRITRADGRLVAVVTQTQMVLRPREQ